MKTGLKRLSLQFKWIFGSYLASLSVIFSSHDWSLDAFLPHGLERQKTSQIDLVWCPKKDEIEIYSFIWTSSDCQFKIGQHIPRHLVIGFITFQAMFSCFLITQIISIHTNCCGSLSLAFITWLLFMKFHNGGGIST